MSNQRHQPFIVSDPPNRRCVVMVVDDSPDVHELYRAVLDNRDFEVISSLSARDALERLADGVFPDVFMVDLLMPGMDGMEFIVALRASPEFADAPVVIVSRLSVPLSVRREDVEYVTKPFCMDDLAYAMEAAMRKAEEAVQDAIPLRPDRGISAQCGTPARSRMN